MGVLAQVTMEQQKNDQWCWAAVTGSVFNFLQNASITQEEVVCRVLNNPACSTQPTPSECDRPSLLDIALPQICPCNLSTQGVLPFSDLQDQIDNHSHPVPIALEFATRLGSVVHYCLIKGCNEAAGGQEIILLDPAHMNAGECHISYVDLCDGAVLGATWIQSFVIQ
jgi:Papain-like cysteine protease AvrRpt2